MEAAIHRIIEHNVASRGDAVALLQGTRQVTYRELNQRANATARHLIANGFRRGSRAIIRMDRSVDLVVLLLAVLKAGGAYTLVDPSDPRPATALSLKHAEFGISEVVLDAATTVRTDRARGPNLPVITRGSDVACVLPGDGGVSAVFIPHSTVTALCGNPLPPVTEWPDDDAGALGLWLALMAGSTVVVRAGAATAAA